MNACYAYIILKQVQNQIQAYYLCMLGKHYFEPDSSKVPKCNSDNLSNQNACIKQCQTAVFMFSLSDSQCIYFCFFERANK